MRPSLPLILALSLVGERAGAQEVPDRFRAVRDSLVKLVDAKVAPSIAVSVVTRNGVVWEAAFGMADVERGRRATAFTAYPVASVAKSLTALGALRAVDHGLLDLDRPVSAYLGADAVSVPVGNADSLTTRAVLHMTGGIPHVVNFRWTDAPRAALLDAPIGHFAAFPPGSQFHYSNQSLGIVGEILARVSHQPLGRYLSAAVFRPLGMDATVVRLDALPQKSRARTYQGTPLRFVPFTRLDPEGGAGMYSSAHDLTTLARRVFLDPESKFLSAKAKAEIFDFDQYPFYSAGWWRDPFRAKGLTLVADGAAVGHAASLKILPDEGIAVAVLVNASVPDGTTMALCDLLLAAAGHDIPHLTMAEIPAQFVDHPIAGDTTWAGRWSGFVRAGSREVPIAIRIDSSGFRGVVGADAGFPLTASQATAAIGVLEANIGGSLPAYAVAGQPHTLQVKLRRSGALLTGYVTASARLGDRPLYMLPYFVSLKRESLR